jgi:hypothetical protein
MASPQVTEPKWVSASKPVDTIDRHLTSQSVTSNTSKVRNDYKGNNLETSFSTPFISRTLEPSQSIQRTTELHQIPFNPRPKGTPLQQPYWDYHATDTPFSLNNYSTNNSVTSQQHAQIPTSKQLDQPHATESHTSSTVGPTYNLYSKGNQFQDSVFTANSTQQRIFSHHPAYVPLTPTPDI